MDVRYITCRFTFHLPVDRGLDSWNPMQDDHLDQEFNMYDRGPGKDMPKRGADRYG